MKKKYENYIKDFDSSNPYHILSLVAVIIFGGYLLLILLKILIYLAIWGGIGYLIYLYWTKNVEKKEKKAR